MIQIARRIVEIEELLAFELIKRMVLAWHSDFTKLTLSERKAIEKTDRELINNEIVKRSNVWI